MDRFEVKFAVTEDEIRKTFILRYEDMISEYSEYASLKTNHDITSYDKIAKHIIVVDHENDDAVVACYRMVLSSWLKDGDKFICEKEFSIDKLKAQNEVICELSRAVVKKEYRNGLLLLMIWKFIFDYSKEANIRYLIGDASFIGVKREDYLKEISYVVNNYPVEDDLEIHSLDSLEKMNLLPKDEVEFDSIKNSLPPLIKAYISFGAKFSKECFTDYEFGSVDLFVLLDTTKFNERFIKKMFRI